MDVEVVEEEVVGEVTDEEEPEVHRRRAHSIHGGGVLPYAFARRPCTTVLPQGWVGAGKVGVEVGGPVDSRPAGAFFDAHLRT